MPLGKLWPNRRGPTRARGVITSELGQNAKYPLRANVFRYQAPTPGSTGKANGALALFCDARSLGINRTQEAERLELLAEEYSTISPIASSASFARREARRQKVGLKTSRGTR